VPLDALTVVQRPVHDQQTPPNPIAPPAALAGIEQPGNPWLLRNKNWSAEPDFYRAVANGNWVAELKDLPDGTERVYVSGGHAHPQYFAVVRASTGLAFMERRYRRGQKIPTWTTVFNGVIDWTTKCEPWEGWYGPVFVNPYDSSKIFLLAPDGVKVSHRDSTGTLAFADDKVLTSLITASFTYPIVRQFCGGNTTHAVMAQRMLGTTTLGLVSFFRDDPAKTIVASPFTGVFYDRGDGTWRSFSNILPQGYVWAVRLDDSHAYIGFAGRSIGQVDGIDHALRATYFTREQGFIPRLGGGNSIIARLQVSDGTAIGNQVVSLRICGADGRTTFFAPILHLDGQGRVLAPVTLPGSAVHVHFMGVEKKGLVASEIHYIY
jgi:hypothetical protein